MGNAGNEGRLRRKGTHCYAACTPLPQESPLQHTHNNHNHTHTGVCTHVMFV